MHGGDFGGALSGGERLRLLTTKRAKPGSLQLAD